MANNPHRPGSSAAQSFRADEVEALHVIVAAWLAGRNPRDVRGVQPATVGRLARKAESMRRSIERQRREMEGRDGE